MPLINGGQLFEVNHQTDDEITEGETYWLRAEVSWYDIERMKDDQAVKMSMNPAIMAALQKGENVDALIAEQMTAGIDMAELKLKQLEVMLVKWSHKQSVNKQTLSHLDPVTVRVLFRHIRRIITESKARGIENAPLASD